MVHFGSFRQGEDLTQYCIVNKEKSFIVVPLPYRNDPMFSDRYVWANSAGSTLFAIPSASFGLITLW